MIPQNSPLLRLPREIRDIIFEYALTFVNGLVKGSSKELYLADSTVANQDDEQARMTEANRLKYVCPQIYHETRGLLLCLNNTIRMRGPDLRPLVRFMPAFNTPRCRIRRINFMVRHTYTGSRAMLLQNVAILMVSPEFAQVDVFCSQHPTITVCLYFEFRRQPPACLETTFEILEIVLGRLRNSSVGLYPTMVNGNMPTIWGLTVARILSTHFRLTLRLLEYNGTLASNLRFNLVFEKETTVMAGPHPFCDFCGLETRWDCGCEIGVAAVLERYEDGL
jgi:hypothetical protein